MWHMSLFRLIISLALLSSECLAVTPGFHAAGVPSQGAGSLRLAMSASGGSSCPGRPVLCARTQGWAGTQHLRGSWHLLLGTRVGTRGRSSRAIGDSLRAEAAGGMRPAGDQEGVSEDDRAFMQRALDLAEMGKGKTYPNPCVGCVLVKDGEVVGEGFHPKAGMPHAEVSRGLPTVDSPPLVRIASCFFPHQFFLRGARSSPLIAAIEHLFNLGHQLTAPHHPHPP